MIPVVDIGCYVRTTTGKGLEEDLKTVAEKPEVKEVVRQLYAAICQHGFCFLSNHGVSENTVTGLMSSCKAFFESPAEIKEKYAQLGDSKHGWKGLESERLNHDRPHGDPKEVFDFNPCEAVDDWPSADMRRHFTDTFRHCQETTNRVLDLMTMALQFKDHSFLRKCHQLIGKKGNYTALRSLYYPPTTDFKEEQIQCGEHSDFGTITLLFQDDTGGLQVMGKDGHYRDVTPVPGAVLMNIGDLMQRWTADRFPSTMHRVIVPVQAAREGRARQSLAFFVHPDEDTLITCLDGSNTYPPITAYDYLWQRLGATY